MNIPLPKDKYYELSVLLQQTSDAIVRAWDKELSKPLQEKYGVVAVRWAEEATRPGDMEGVEVAAEYYYGKSKEVFGLGHMSPQLSEKQIRKLRELLGLTADVAEILRIHKRTGYIS